MRGFRRTTWLASLLAVCLAAGVATPESGDVYLGGKKLGVKVDPVKRRIQEMKLKPPTDDPAPIWDYRDLDLQSDVEAAIERMGLSAAVREKRLGLALVDITDLDEPKLASLNGERMLYAASLPKIAILLAAFEQIAAGELEHDAELDKAMKSMIRDSSNSAATFVMLLVGKQKIAEILTSERYRLYDPLHGGGLWLGKDYAKKGLWRRDPLHNLSHGASAIEVARFWYMLEKEELVSQKHSRQMKEILGTTHLNHKFAKALMSINTNARIMRKSGSWREYHSDSAVIRHRGYAYIIVGLCVDKAGSLWLEQMQREFDQLIAARHRR